MRIIVTGGGGFLGYHLVKALLAARHTVLVFDDFSTGAHENLTDLEAIVRQRVDAKDPAVDRQLWLHAGDVRDPWTGIRSAFPKVDRVYHLACPASPIHYQADPVKTIETAFLGTRNALEFAEWSSAQTRPCRVLLASTSEVYGDPLVTPQPESYWGNTNPFGPRAMYDEGKRAGEALAWSYMYDPKRAVDVRIARIFNTYGPRMRFDDGRVVSNFVLQALRGEPLTIYGDGAQTRSFCYVDDTIRGLMSLMEVSPEPRLGPVNLGNHHQVSMRDLVEILGLALGHATLRTRTLPLPGDDPKQRCPDIGRARRLLGWEPKIPILEGLRRTVDDFRARLAADARIADEVVEAVGP